MNSYLETTFGLSGKKAVVTGAGKGIGKAIAEALAASGAEVLVHYHSSRDAAETLVKEIDSRGGKAWSCGADLTDSKDTDSLFKQVEERWGALDILVNNAGDMVQRSRFSDIGDDVIEKVLRVNVHTAIYAIRAATPLLRKGKNACVVNLSSVAAHHGGGNGSVLYAAAKGLILTMTRGLSKEYAPGIRINGIAPGAILTDFHRKHSTPQILETMAGNTPLKRIGTAEECAAAVVFLCGPGAAFITGETIEINGGLWLA